jgi:uncharacterized protein (TIGR03085 family)
VTSLARRERAALCDLASRLGPDAPTLCTGWDVTGLLAHLHVREHAPLAGLAPVVPPLRPFGERATTRRRAWPFAALVDRVRRPPLLLRAVPPLDAVMNGAEFLVHHEDIRRAQEGWTPRELTAAEHEDAWKAACQMGLYASRKLPVPVVISDGAGRSRAFKRGADPVTITGEPVEILLFLTGRSALGPLDFAGPIAAIDRLQATNRRI